MCSIQFECCPSTTVTLGPIKNSLIILSLYLSTVFQSFRAGEKGYYVTNLPVYYTTQVEHTTMQLETMVNYKCYVYSIMLPVHVNFYAKNTKEVV